MAERLRPVLDEPCPGQECGGTEARFTRRLIAASVTIHLQCQRCGKSLAGALKRSEFYNWQDMPEWNESLRSDHDDAQQARFRQSIGEVEAEREKRAAEAARRRSDYRRWLLTSPDWAVLRDRVMRRALLTCEACLANHASDVHHVTYALGRLPPAWELRAVCRACHDRLHDWTGGE